MVPEEAPQRMVPLTVQNQIEGMESLTDDDERYSFYLIFYIVLYNKI